MVQVTAHVGVLDATLDVAVPFVMVQTGDSHTAYNVVEPLLIIFLISAFRPYAVPDPSAAVFQPVSTFCDAPLPFVMLHVLLFHVGVAHAASYVHV